jgi:DNA (cytosine-5)-methyltransferase 1
LRGAARGAVRCSPDALAADNHRLAADLGIKGGHGLPFPAAGLGSTGDLLPNCTITGKETAGFVCTRDAISDLPPVPAGEEATRYAGPPVSGYQREMRAALDGDLPGFLASHYAASLSAANLTRLRMLKPGQDWRDLPHDMLPSGMQRALRKDHTRRYRRMTWDGIPRSVITRFRDPKSGEYAHPEQDKTITNREAARLQGLPDRFVFQSPARRRRGRRTARGRRRTCARRPGGR